MISFVVFKAPPEGCTHVFRRGEPFLQLLVVPVGDELELVAMEFEEAAERTLQAERIHASRATLGKASTRLSATDTVFDATYRNLLGAVNAKRRKTAGRHRSAMTTRRAHQEPGHRNRAWLPGGMRVPWIPAD